MNLFSYFPPKGRRERERGGGTKKEERWKDGKCLSHTEQCDENRGIELERGVSRVAWKRNDVTNVLHTSYKLNKSLKAEAITRMGDGSVPTKVEVPPIILLQFTVRERKTSKDRKDVRFRS